MNNFMKFASSTSNRYVIEDDVPKVTSDGEPHEIMTMVAAFSGIIAAAVVLIILIMLIGCRSNDSQRRQDPESNNNNNNNRNKNNNSSSEIKENSKMPHVFTIETDHHKLSSLPQISSEKIIENSFYDNGNFINDELCENDKNLKEKFTSITVIDIPEIIPKRM